MAGLARWFVMTVQDAGRWWIVGWAVVGAVLGYVIAGWDGALGFSVGCVFALFLAVARDNALDWVLDRQTRAKAKRTAAKRSARRAEQPPGEPPWWKQIDE